MDTPYFVPFPNDLPTRIFHRTRGCGHDKYAIAVCPDSDTAMRIMRLLNADEKSREKGTAK